MFASSQDLPHFGVFGCPCIYDLAIHDVSVIFCGRPMHCQLHSPSGERFQNSRERFQNLEVRSHTAEGKSLSGSDILLRVDFRVNLRASPLFATLLWEGDHLFF